MATEVIMPQLGESVVEGTVMRWLKQEGEQIEENELLLEVDTDKVSTEIPSPASGTLIKILVPEGTTVAARTVIALIGEPGEEVAAPEEQPAESQAPPAGSDGKQDAPGGEAQPTTPPPGRDRDLGFISPVVARLAREHSVDLSQVQGTGEGGRITKKDVRAFIEGGGAAEKPAEPVVEAPAWETPGEGDLFRPTELQFSGGMPGRDAPAKPETASEPAPGPARPAEAAQAGGTLIPHTRMRRSIAEHMVASKRTSPHVTTIMEADMSRVAAHMNASTASFERDGARLTYTAYFIAAMVAALKAFPKANSSWSDEGIILHPQINIGMATSLGEEGLIVPVIHGADSYSLLGLARKIGDLAGRARSRQLQPDEVKGGTITLTNHGISGSLFATPVINQPQAGIVGVGAIQKRAVVVESAGGDALAIRPMVYLSFTFDHRILDGASADHFLAKIVQTLQEWS